MDAETFKALLIEIQTADSEETLMIASLKIPSVAAVGSPDYDRLIRASGWRRIDLMDRKVLI